MFQKSQGKYGLKVVYTQTSGLGTSKVDCHEKRQAIRTAKKFAKRPVVQYVLVYMRKPPYTNLYHAKMVDGRLVETTTF